MLSKNLEHVLKQHSPQSLKELTRDVIDSTKNANSHTRKFMNPERVQRAHEGIRFLTSQNVPIHIAMGIIANGIAENGLSTDAHKHGLGIFQWIGARARQFRNMRANLPGATEFEKQLSFVLHELKTTERAAGVALANARTPEEAARIFMVKFERPKHLNFDVRQGLATGLRNLTSAGQEAQNPKNNTPPELPDGQLFANTSSENLNEPSTDFASQRNSGERILTSTNLQNNDSELV